MARPGAGGDQDNVDADVVAGACVTRHQDFGRRGNPGETAFIDSEIAFGSRRPGFDLDKGDQVSAPRDQVHFPGGRANPAVENSPALQSEPPAGDALAATPGCFGYAAVSQSFMPMARA